jgi:hypothetical protein
MRFLTVGSLVSIVALSACGDGGTKRDAAADVKGGSGGGGG